MNPSRLSVAGRGRRFSLVVSRFNAPVTERLCQGAIECLVEHGARREDLDIHDVPGAWELPLAVRLVLDRGGVDGVLALGCVIRGETPHFDFVALGATRGLASLALESGIPVGFGLLTTEDGDQAMARAGGAKGNKGRETALAVLDMCRLAEELRGRS